MKYFTKKDVEWELESALSESYNGKGHRIICGHDGVVISSQPQMDIGRDRKFLPKILKLGRGIYPMSLHTHDIDLN